MDKKNKWIKLNRPPVIMAVFQLQFESGVVDIKEYLSYDRLIIASLPLRTENINIEASIDMGGTPALGVSKITGTSDTKITSYTFLTDDKKLKLTLGNQSITYNSERVYQGWEEFIAEIESYLKILTPMLNKLTINRISIRFINKFLLKEFNNPIDYFKTTISSTDENGLCFPVVNYGFKITYKIPEKDIHSIVNQKVDTLAPDKYIYIFDIDVLDRKNHIFNIDTILNSLNELREIKNQIFFDNLTTKTIELCN